MLFYGFSRQKGLKLFGQFHALTTKVTVVVVAAIK